MIASRPSPRRWRCSPSRLRWRRVEGGDTEEDHDDHHAAPTTTTVAVPIAPLTGLPDPGGASLTRPALSVKVENTDAAAAPGRHRPGRRRLRGGGRGQHHPLRRDLQLDRARRRSARCGRSAPRTPTSCGRSVGIFAYSGGAPVNVDADQRGAGHAVDENNAGDAWSATSRASRRVARRTTSTALGQPLFDARRRPEAAAGAVPVPRPPARRRGGARRSLELPRRLRPPGYDPTWTWDAATGTWKRSIQRRAPARSSGARRSRPPTSWSSSRPTPARPRRRPSARATSGSSATARCARGRWVRPDRAQPAQLRRRRRRDRSRCARARTWVELLPAGRAVDLVDRAAAAPTTDGAAATDAPPTTAKKKKQVAAWRRSDWSRSDSRPMTGSAHHGHRPRSSGAWPRCCAAA